MNLMASDRSPLSKRFRSLAQRAGLPVDDASPAGREPVSPPPAAAAAPAPPKPPAAEAPADEQPTGDVPVVAEQPTDDQPVLRVADEQPTVASDALRTVDPPAASDPFAHEDGPTLAPPVLPARPVDEPAADAPSAAPDAQADEAVDDDEPFSPRTTIWPQTAPTPRFERRDERPAAHSTSDPTFPAASSAPADEDPSAVEPFGVTGPAQAADTPPTPAAPAFEPDPEPEPAHEPSAAGRAVEVAPSADVTSEQPALDPDAAAGKRGRFGALRRRGPKTPKAAPAPAEHEAAEAAQTPEPVAAPTAALAPPEPQADAPRAAEPAAAPYEPPAKPSFAERAALRRRAKTLRARRDAGLLELGAIVLDQRRFGDPTGGSLTRRRTDELADIDGELAAIEQVLDDDGPAETVAQLGVARCLSCTALVGPRDRFCVQCGAPRPEADGRPSHAA